MCGITGWVAFERDLTAEPDAADVLDAMTATQLRRGPDAGGVLLQPHAALGHRRLAVIDIEGGTQPMTVERDGRLLAALTYSGEVYNHRELRAELEAAGHRFRTRSDTEVVLHAYLEWGEGLAGRLNGMFAFAVWDARREELLLVRDRMGVKPLHYRATPDGVIFGSEVKALLAHPAVRPVVDLDGLRELLGHTRTPGLTPYRDVREVRPGHVVRVRRGGVSEHRYWALEAREHADSLPATVATVRALLDDIVHRQLDADVPLCSLLSGGLDSSAVTAIAARLLRSAGAGPVRSFSVGFSGQGEDFHSDAVRQTPDGPYARLLAGHVGADHSVVELDAAELTDPSRRSAALRARDLPNGVGDMDVSLLLLFRGVRRHSTVALSGESADELFGGYRWFHDPQSIATEDFPWAAGLTHIAGAGSGPREELLDSGLLRKLDLEDYRRARYREALAEVPHLAAADPLERRMREISYLNLTRFVRILLDRKDRMSMANGLEVRVPFCDHRLVQYVFNVPWAMKSFDGREKSLLRAAVRNVLPATIADRPKSPYPVTTDPHYPARLRSELARLSTTRTSPALGLLDRRRLADALAPDTDPRSVRLGVDLALDLDAWLTEYQVTLEL
ncbi:asparagine synthase (glutamine-hydrolysing) [Streptomyces sp. 1114.5]|uniref:asparagine synthase (glutamine-hydrolyzing) n=1 Tax=unclassified Streptomyces TaxID=2593676 RepID=UPI000BCA2E41|nr:MULTISPECIES: asparagine synthase (glutamine-hydrolyzing) [unclassified Streptomyces]RKT12109.1 asparagine synthase (glutamine-hydrolysing) [Streptomyces sp. 1114.5]SOB79865.1 asparagine synthase (glutamine-hydrolysing) [Streptomyces sp. 1331.2]